jgi:hypothetical protein
MSKLRTALIAGAITCGLLFAPAVAGAQTQAPLSKKVAVTGTKGFSGTYTIDRFVARRGKLVSVGTLKGKLRGKRVVRRDVRMPAGLPATGKTAQVPTIPGACQVLNLVLGPINLNLLGLSVRTNQINLRIDAVPGAGNLLGNLLCGITNLLNPAGLPALSQLTQILNALLALSPRTA